jgi:hypothetical protein
MKPSKQQIFSINFVDIFTALHWCVREKFTTPLHRSKEQCALYRVVKYLRRGDRSEITFLGVFLNISENSGKNQT